jgi:hypothetical protein
MITDTFTAVGAMNLKINKVIYANKYHYTILFVKENIYRSKKLLFGDDLLSVKSRF